MDTPYIREFLEDREITAWFLLDLSPSVDFGTVESERLKRSVLVDFVTTLARVLTRHGNKVGRGVLRVAGRADDPGARRAGPGAAAHQRPRRRIRGSASAPFTDLTPLLEAGQRWIKGRSLVFVISDFISAPGWERALEGLTRKHEVIAVRLYDRRERSCPTSGRCSWTTPRPASSSYVDTHDPTFRRRYRGGGASGARRSCAAAFRRAGVDAVSLVDRRRPARGDRPDGRAPKADRSGSPMSFIWPPLLLLLLAIPVGVWAVPVAGAAAGGAGGAVRVGVGGGAAAAGGVGAGGPRPWTRRIPAALTVAGVTILVLSLARPAERHRRPAPRGHGHPRVRRLGQHGRHGRRPDPDGGGQGRGARVHRAASRLGPHRDRRLQRHRLLDPGPDRRPRRARGRDRAPRAGARHVAGPRHPGGAAGHRARRRPVEDRLLHRTPPPAPTAGTDAGPGAASTSRRSSCC